ncbi:hypothetical protein B0H14DRAFT_2594997 [Mycena olivaceomarginata]|nr:hypothetical protein B0H14DRAFT_2594997 [Mycena olivaceomarginata]
MLSTFAVLLATAAAAQSTPVQVSARQPFENLPRKIAGRSKSSHKLASKKSLSSRIRDELVHAAPPSMNGCGNSGSMFNFKLKLKLNCHIRLRMSRGLSNVPRNSMLQHVQTGTQIDKKSVYCILGPELIVGGSPGFDSLGPNVASF